MRRARRGVSKPADLLFAFDAAYAADPYRIYSIVEAALSQVGSHFGVVHLFCQGGYRGPRFLGGEPRVVVHGSRRGLWRRAGRLLARARITESPARFVSNVAAPVEPLLCALAKHQNFGCVISFSADLAFPITALRLAHLYAGDEPPLMVAVTPKTFANRDQVQELTGLGATLLCDAELAAATGNFGASAKRASIEPEAICFASGTPLRFTRAETYPPAGVTECPAVRWRDYADPDGRPHPLPRDVILFVRPDWTHCGSATTFRNLARHFRDRGALMIDIAIWPYARPRDAASQEARIAEEQGEIDAALYFSVQRTGCLAHLVAVACRAMIGRPPITIVRQKLLQYALAAKPGVMRIALRQARISHIYLNHFFTHEYARSFIRDRRFFLDTHDIQTINWVQGGAINALTRRGDHFQTLLHDELRVLSKAHRLSFVNDDELVLAEQIIPREKLSVIIALPDIAACAPKPLGNQRRLLIVASRNLPNKRGLDWFLREVWPLILAGGRNGTSAHAWPVSLDICGSIALDFQGMRFPFCDFHGQVEELQSFYARSDAVLLPVVMGGGVAIKTIEAILHGRPMIATRHALRGLPDDIVQCIGYANDPRQFAAAVVKLVSSRVEIDNATARVAQAAALIRRQGYDDRLDVAMADVRISSRYDLRGRIRHTLDRFFLMQERSRGLVVDPANVVLDGDPSWLESIFSRRAVHDEDYQIFRYFHDLTSLVLDIGANYGYSAASIISTGCESCILSFEPIAPLSSCLAEVVRLNPGRCDYRMTALGAAEGSQTFVMPVLNGRGITALTTADPQPHLDSLAQNICAYKQDHMTAEEFKSLRFCSFTAPIQTLDSVLKSGGPFGVPTSRIVAAKIDTEGTEAEVLAGAADTLAIHRPLILIEGANRQLRVREILGGAGYEFADRMGDRLARSNEISTRPNGFFLHSSRISEYRASGLLCN
jgi:FkbM family methyltransferase